MRSHSSLDNGERDVSGPTISLPNIEALTIYCEPTEDFDPDLYYLLQVSHLTLPIDAQIDLCSIVPFRGSEYLGTIPQDPDRLPMIYTATYAKIWATTFECYPEAPD